ncbi:pleckstrin homology domain-containing family A member 2 isoform X1 [Scophthalmus maximus]|uniref:pleckstrin homology domain-containing family A member 2 isoform X1 n=1 Tax=Scophthalmus maximus TaxID=52904 RepID=UPI001FA8DB92|nr:pleckstrin homology domain-containing family A member 2 isoform X1 [Scophthalmus maximus]XP_035495958.2 pleckstrin homology domain-containing family A member 2 isoform X1 [Scophthalmus maximus]XP_035495959.2 pleckstrin homology domain-containing family A member 2 isoform X1 [Scophthalmus maximus]
MPYVDRLNRVCGFLDVEEKENSCRFQRRYFILDTQGNALLWYMDNPQNLPSGASFVGSLKLTYISKVNEATAKQKPKTEFCFVINAVSRRYFLQANDVTDMRDWVAALNKASKITVPKSGPAPPRSDVTAVISDTQGGKRQQAYKTEIIGGVVVHTPIQNESEETEGRDRKGNRLGVLRCGYCVKQGNVRKSWKRRFFILDDTAVSYYKSEADKDPLRAIPLRDIQRVHECLVKSGIFFSPRELLLRDNLFEIITGSRTFYIQTDSPEEMHGWIRDIEMKIQEFRGPPKGFSFKRASSLYRSHNSSSASRGPQGDECRPALVKSCSVAPGWQPWTPVPPCEPSILDAEDEDSAFSSVPNLPSLSSSSTSSSTSSSSNSLSNPAPSPGVNPVPSTGGLASGDVASGRRRHRSQPQSHTGCSFPFSLDDDGIRTTDV